MRCRRQGRVSFESVQVVVFPILLLKCLLSVDWSCPFVTTSEPLSSLGFWRRAGLPPQTAEDQGDVVKVFSVGESVVNFSSLHFGVNRAATSETSKATSSKTTSASEASTSKTASKATASETSTSKTTSAETTAPKSASSEATSAKLRFGFGISQGECDKDGE